MAPEIASRRRISELFAVSSPSSEIGTWCNQFGRCFSPVGLLNFFPSACRHRDPSVAGSTLTGPSDCKRTLCSETGKNTPEIVHGIAGQRVRSVLLVQAAVDQSDQRFGGEFEINGALLRRFGEVDRVDVENH